MGDTLCSQFVTPSMHPGRIVQLDLLQSATIVPVRPFLLILRWEYEEDVFLLSNGRHSTLIDGETECLYRRPNQVELWLTSRGLIQPIECMADLWHS